MRVNMINTVRGFIEAKPKLADNDIDLIWAIWSWQMGKLKPPKKIENLKARDLMSCWKEGLVSSPFNISRSRRKCQELYPKTSGEVYNGRQDHQRRIRKDVKDAADLSS